MWKLWILKVLFAGLLLGLISYAIIFVISKSSKCYVCNVLSFFFYNAFWFSYCLLFLQLGYLIGVWFLLPVCWLPSFSVLLPLKQVLLSLWTRIRLLYLVIRWDISLTDSLVACFISMEITYWHIFCSVFDFLILVPFLYLFHVHSAGFQYGGRVLLWFVFIYSALVIISQVIFLILCTILDWRWTVADAWWIKLIGLMK